MKLTHNSPKQVTGVALMALLMVLPGCDWFSTSKDTSKSQPAPSAGKPADTQATTPANEEDILVRMNGKSLITRKSLEEAKDDLTRTNPQLKAVFAFMPAKQLDRNLAEGLTNQAVVHEYIVAQGIDKSPEFQEEWERMQRSLKNMLETKFFSQNLTVDVSDSEVEKFYNENKDNIPKLLLSHGGTKAMGVSFDSQDKAQAFLTKVNEQKGNIQKAAEGASLADKVQDFHLVHEQSIGVDAGLRDKIMAFKKVPVTEIVKLDDKTFWVVHASEKQEPKYQPLELIKPDLVRHLKEEKRTELLEKEIEKLRNQYKIEFKEEYFAADDQQGQEAPSEALGEEND